MVAAGSSLTGSSLTGSSLTGSSLTGAVLTGAVLTGTALAGTVRRLRWVSLPTGGTLRGWVMILTGATLPGRGWWSPRILPKFSRGKSFSPRKRSRTGLTVRATLTARAARAARAATRGRSGCGIRSSTWAPGSSGRCHCAGRAPTTSAPAWPSCGSLPGRRAGPTGSGPGSGCSPRRRAVIWWRGRDFRRPLLVRTDGCRTPAPDATARRVGPCCRRRCPRRTVWDCGSGTP
ncbi:pentapeptide repeat-containing protein [Kineosporia corallincola]|uniref:pentapeptide repeat-containing protein n=1 Tax=Kineosporia corallincola TaxID=2835133 RepID=UPI003557CBB4